MDGVCVLYEQPCFRSVYEGLTEAGISSEDKDGSAILVWHDSLKDIDFFSPLYPWQMINRLPCVNVICRKAPFAYLLNKIGEKYPDLYSYVPKSFILPAQKEEFQKALAKKDIPYIYKPDGRSQGAGIIVLEPGSPEADNIKFDELAIVQEYVSSYLIDRKKFDLRLYVLVASLNPLRIYVYRNGLARFCSEEATEGSLFSQLTNVSLNRDNPKAEISEVSQLVSDIVPKMEAAGVNMEEVWSRIDNAVVLTVISAHKLLSQAEEWFCPPIGYPRCFQILGFDILLDSDLQPKIMEVNNRPSLDYYRGKERRMKVGMIRDAARIACPMKMAQAAIFARKWGWTAETWRTFVQQTPAVIESAEVERAEALKNSNFVQAYPNPNHPNASKWEEAFKTVYEMPLEYLPGFAPPQERNAPRPQTHEPPV